MAGSSTGILFRVTTWGESHGPSVGCVVDGCPPGLTLDLDAIQRQLDRRRPGQSSLTSQRKEADRVEALSGLQDGVTLGTPIALLVRNKDARPGAYREVQAAYRPSHADFTYDRKFGIAARSGGGRASARETVGRVAAAGIARQLLAEPGVQIVAWVDQVGDITLPEGTVDEQQIDEALVDAGPTRCPDPATAAAMQSLIRSVQADGDSVGGAIRCVIRGVPVGWGEPVFDKLEAELARALLSLPASKAFEVGSGFRGITMRGSEHNDAFEPDPDADSGVRTRSNHSGGIQGGISNGEAIRLRVGFKPVATIFREQDTVTPSGEATVLKPKGRHDPCVLPRAVPMVEACVALVLADMHLRQRAIR